MNSDLLPPAKSPRKRGIALVLVLGFVTLVAILVTAFFSSATTELASSKSYSDGVSAKGLSDSAVSAVMGIIREATSGGPKVAWASQPGMLRTYDDKGNMLKAYKLYSSAQMTTSTFDLTGDLDTLWKDKPGLFTDLNRPISVIAPDGSATLRYPILDPAANSKYKNPADTSPSVEGFSLTNPPGYVDSGTSGISPANNPAPMPVKWIYQLRDGTMAVPDTYNNGIATFTSDPKPTKANPIVGRIAFWTDDESCKVNINTAAGDLAPLKLTGTDAGSFWDSPRAWSLMDDRFTKSQVATNEFQRYPGHPATIALSAVFPTIIRPQIGSLAPRIAFGGSQGGSVDNYVQGTVAALARKGDRLYGTVDEFLFQPNAGAAQRDPNIPTIVTPEVLEKARFFLTASGRVPELNLFGQPRVGIWPIHESTAATHRTVSDSLLAFCSTVGGKRYHFTRGNNDGTSTSTDRDTDYAGNKRNQEIYAYLRGLMDKPIPGFGGPANGFGTKYGTLNRDQILTEIFDYIRITNLQDKSLGANARYTPNTGAPGSGQVVPIKIKTSAGDTKGFGRMPTISEAALQFYATQTQASPAKTLKMRAVLLLETFNPAPGYAGHYPSYSHTISGLENLSITIGAQTLNLNFPANATNNVSRSNGQHSRIISSTQGIANTFYSLSGAFKKIPGLDPNINYPFISQTDIDLSAATVSTMRLNGGTVSLTIRCKDSTGVVVQTVKLNFPAIAAMPLPTKPSTATFIDYQTRINNLTASASDIIDANDVIHSLEPSGTPVNGDLRLVATSEDVPETVFQPHAAYLSNTKLAHSLKTGINRSYDSSTYGKLIAGLNYGGYQPSGSPDFPSKIITGALMQNGQPGDWDNGIANYLDGPYINKADEGTTSLTSQGGTPYWSSNTDSFDATTLFSPNRQIASPVMFGSLSTGVGYSTQRPWQTLLFRPDVAGSHPGSAAPKDYLLLDLFTMPIVEPYAISEPLSTAGKVNMNYQIAPFTYINRETAVRAALQSIFTMSIPDSDSAKYKQIGANNAVYRNQVNADETLQQFKARFDKAEVFKSAAEICDLHLVPKGGTLAAMQSAAYWTGYRLTGDNTREMPYNHLYPLLTTKSNTYTVHMWVETLNHGVPKNAPDTDARWAQWDESRGQVTAQYRGSTLIERYIDPQDPRLTTAFDETYTGATVTDSSGNITKSGSLDPFYRFRVLNTKRFDR